MIAALVETVVDVGRREGWCWKVRWSNMADGGQTGLEDVNVNPLSPRMHVLASRGWRRVHGGHGMMMMMYGRTTA